MEEEPPPPTPTPTPTPPPPRSSRTASRSERARPGAGRGGGSLRPGAAPGWGAWPGGARGAPFPAAATSFPTAAAAAAAARGSRGAGVSGLAGAAKAGSPGSSSSSSSSSSSLPSGSGSLPSAADPGPAAAGARRPPPEPWAAVAAPALVLLLLFLLSSLGNCAVMGAIGRHRQLRTVTNAFILSLSLSNLLPALVGPPAAFLALVARPAGARPWLRLCASSRFFSSCGGIAATLTMTLICLDRYNAIVRQPGQKLGRRRALRLVLAVWLVAAGCSCPWELLAPSLGPGAPGAPKSFHRCLYQSHLGPSRLGPTYNIWLVVTCYLCPFGIMCFCLYQICRTVRLSERRLRPAAPYARLLRLSSERRTATTVLLMIVFIALCWGPYCLLVLLAAAAGAAGARTPPVPPALDAVALWMAWANGAINPLIYAVRNPNISALLRRRREEGYRTRNVAARSSGRGGDPEARSVARRLRDRSAHRFGVCGRVSASSSAPGEGGREVAVWACKNPALLFCRDGLPDTTTEVASQDKTADTSL